MAYQFNTNSIPATGSVAVFALRTVLIAQGWTQQNSGDGMAAFGAGAVTSGAAGANGLGNTDAWIRLRDPAGVREIVFQRWVTDQHWYIKYSASAGFTGGAPSATQVPSATDEKIIYGTGPDNAFAGGQWLPTNNTYRMNIAAGDVSVGYGWYFDVFPTGNAAGTHNSMLWEIMAAGSFPVADVDPFVIYITPPGGTTSAWATDFWDGSQIHGWFGTGGGRTWQVVRATVYYAVAEGAGHFPAYTAGWGAGQNSFTTNDDALPVPFGRLATAPAPSGWKGFSSMIKYSSTVRANYDTYSISAPGAMDWVWINGVILPWDGSVPVI